MTLFHKGSTNIFSVPIEDVKDHWLLDKISKTFGKCYIETANTTLGNKQETYLFYKGDPKQDNRLKFPSWLAQEPFLILKTNPARFLFDGNEYDEEQFGRVLDLMAFH